MTTATAPMILAPLEGFTLPPAFTFQMNVSPLVDNLRPGLVDTVQSRANSMSHWMRDHFAIAEHTKPQVNINIRDQQHWRVRFPFYPFSYWCIRETGLPDSTHKIFDRYFRPVFDPTQGGNRDQLQHLAELFGATGEIETYDQFLKKLDEKEAYDHLVATALLTHELGHQILYASDVSRTVRLTVEEILASWLRFSFLQDQGIDHAKMNWLYDCLCSSFGDQVREKKSSIIYPPFTSGGDYLWYCIKHEQDVGRPFSQQDPSAVIRLIARMQQEARALGVTPQNPEDRNNGWKNANGEIITNQRFVELVAEVLGISAEELAGNPEQNFTLNALYTGNE